MRGKPCGVVGDCEVSDEREEKGMKKAKYKLVDYRSNGWFITYKNARVNVRLSTTLSYRIYKWRI